MQPIPGWAPCGATHTPGHQHPSAAATDGTCDIPGRVSGGSRSALVRLGAAWRSARDDVARGGAARGRAARDCVLRGGAAHVGAAHGDAELGGGEAVTRQARDDDRAPRADLGGDARRRRRGS